MFPKYQHQLFYHCLGCCNFMSVKINSLWNLQYFNGWVLIKPHFMRGSSLKFALIKTLLRQPELLGRVSVHEMGTGRGWRGEKPRGGDGHLAQGERAEGGHGNADRCGNSVQDASATAHGAPGGREGREASLGLHGMGRARQRGRAMVLGGEERSVWAQEGDARGEGASPAQLLLRGGKPQGRQVKDVRLHRGSTVGRDTCKNRN